MAGTLRRLASLPPALGVITRFDVAVAANTGRNSKEPYEVITCAWHEAIEHYRTRDPQLYHFHTTNGLMEVVCRTFAQLPLEAGAHGAARILASLSYPAYGETPEPKSVWGHFGRMLTEIASDPKPATARFQQRNPVTFESKFDRTPFTSTEAHETRFIFSPSGHSNTAWS